MSVGGLFDLEKHFAFYVAYHSNPINSFIHMLFIWPMFFTALMLLYFVPMIFFQSFGLFSTVVYALVYVGMDKKAGSLAAVLCFLCWFGASSVSSCLGFSLAWKVVLAVEVFCAAIQFIGHEVFEKRAPAFLDNLPQAALMAPFFGLFEALQHFFGYEPYPGFDTKVKIMIDAEIKEWQENKQKKLS